jgi:hypothetical protein
LAAVDLTLIIVLGVVVAAAAVLIFLVANQYINRWKRDFASDQNPRLRADRAHNSLNATRALVGLVTREGGDTRGAELLLARAQLKYEARRYEEALALSKEAQESLAAMRGTLAPRAAATGPARSSSTDPRGSSGPEPVGVRDLSTPAGGGGPGRAREAPPAGTVSDPPKDPGPMGGGEEEGDEGEGGSELERFKRRMPKNYLEARFVLRSLQDEVKAASATRPGQSEVKEAEGWARRSEQAFEAKDYSESLRLALRGRRRLSPEGAGTIGLSAGTLVEPPPEAPSPSVGRSSAPLTGPARPSQGPSASGVAIVRCPRCGRENPSSHRFCRGCGVSLTAPRCPRCNAEVAPEDGFCGACGSPLSL